MTLRDGKGNVINVGRNNDMLLEDLIDSLQEWSNDQSTGDQNEGGLLQQLIDSLKALNKDVASLENITLYSSSTTGTGEPFTVGHCHKANVRISGGATSRTVVFEFTMDGANWEPMNAVKISDLTMSKEITSNNETWELQIAGFYQIRAKVTQISGGSATVKGIAVS